MDKIAFLFPGQGSQKVGMGADLVAAHPAVRARYFDAADEILGIDLTSLCFEGPEEALRSTDNTQPAIFTMSMAVLDVLRQAGIEPDAVAGHSLGEYAALVCAGALQFPDALRLVRRRGELMAAVNARTPGSMVAVIGLPPEAVEGLCATAREGGGVVEPANYNEPEQTVISGEAGPVARAAAMAVEAGARAVPLEVGAPFPGSLMDA
ncbi:MAG TPA: ACP S-malonyltransferase, partial [Euzebya sp.]|nr:ACP S-malonyltransferase [Euzebya sp.]